jgi:hypothetical protein
MREITSLCFSAGSTSDEPNILAIDPRGFRGVAGAVSLSRSDCGPLGDNVCEDKADTTPASLTSLSFKVARGLISPEANKLRCLDELLRFVLAEAGSGFFPHCFY